ncbi:MAG TPA: dihydrodipicolinate reductase [Dehalococcoidia bacterium]|nr:dihydrodipicolinate reductase [Dehalococcoidia bacterium]
MTQKIRAIQYGCGPIGCAVARLAWQRGIELVGAVVRGDKTKVGRDLGELLGIDERLGVIVSDDADAVLAQAKADVVFHQTGSSLTAVFPQLAKIMGFGVNIVSSTEELAYPFQKQPELAAEIDRIAKANKVTVLSTGVNPGFLMDTWPLAMTAVCQAVKKVKAVRIQDARPRRLPFQKKIGAGCTLDEFQRLVDAGTLKHVGLSESIAMIAAGLGWELDEITESIEPVVARERVSSDYITVEPGQAAGVRQVGRGFKGGEELITLEFEASLGAPESYDAVYVTGTPNMEVVIKGGTHGDIATAAMVVNAARRVIEAPPGLLTMKDLPLVACTAG